jgi:hypothetical protein
MLMDVLMLLRNEEKKLLAASNKIGMKLSQIRAAIHALSGNSGKPNADRGNKLRGRNYLRCIVRRSRQELRGRRRRKGEQHKGSFLLSKSCYVCYVGPSDYDLNSPHILLTFLL